jgi:ABC-type glycerol-3-phosphate transport system substrate-binding protein
VKRAGLLSLTFIAVLVCGVIIAGCSRTSTSQPSKLATPRTQAGQPTTQAPQPKDMAAEPAVKIEAYYPVNAGHQFIIDYLKGIEKKYPGQVKLEVYDTQSPEGRKKWSSTGLSCSGVFVNGSTHHEITRNGKTETVDFLKRMDDFWTRDDFEAVVKQLLEKAKTEK